MRFIFFYLTCLLLSNLVCQAEMRQWTSSTGQKMIAEIVSYDKELSTVTIRKKNKKTYTLSVEKFSEADREWLKEWQHKQEMKKAKKEAWLAEMNKNAGKTISIKPEGKITSSYHVYYPKNYDALKNHPMIIIFAPRKNGGIRMLKTIRQGCDALGWIAVGCDPAHPNIIEVIANNVDFDTEQLYLGGLSGGALSAYHSSPLPKRLFGHPCRGIIAYGGSSPYTDVERKMRVAIVNGDKDDAANSFVESATKKLKKQRCEVRKFSFAGGHDIAPPDVTEQVMRWLATENPQ